MKYFVFSDVHGCLRALKEALDNAGYHPDNVNHHLLFLGDAFDKPSDQRDDYGVWLFLKENIENGRLTWIRGNHEEYLLKVLKNEKMNTFCRETIRGIATGIEPTPAKGSDDDCIRALKDNGLDSFMNDHCVNYFETEHYVFTHGFIPYNKRTGYDSEWRNSVKWNYGDNGMRLVLEKGVRIPDKTLVCGHTGAYYGHWFVTQPRLSEKELSKIKNKSAEYLDWFKPFFGDGVIGIDGWCYKTGIIHVLTISD